MAKETERVGTYNLLDEGNVGEVQIADEVVAIIAGLAAEGVTKMKNVHFVERGYENVVEKFTALGANIKRIEE